jgi:hypothetical protein
MLGAGLHRALTVAALAGAGLLLGALVQLVLLLLYRALLATRAWVGLVLRICHGVLLWGFEVTVFAPAAPVTVRLFTYPPHAAKVLRRRKYLIFNAKNIAIYELYGKLSTRRIL